jgi:hypothetical protein
MFTAEFFDPKDDLMERKRTLEQTNEIPDMAQYALDWQELAADFRAIGFVFCASYCQARGDHYGKEAGGEYIKLVEGSFAELIEVPQ